MRARTTRVSRFEAATASCAAARAATRVASSSTMLMIAITTALPTPCSAPPSEVSRRATCAGVTRSPGRAPMTAATRSGRCATAAVSGWPKILAETSASTVVTPDGSTGSSAAGALIQRMRAPSALTSVTSNAPSWCNLASTSGATPPTRPGLGEGCAYTVRLRSRPRSSSAQARRDGSSITGAPSHAGGGAIATVQVRPIRGVRAARCASTRR